MLLLGTALFRPTASLYSLQRFFLCTNVNNFEVNYINEVQKSLSAQHLHPAPCLCFQNQIILAISYSRHAETCLGYAAHFQRYQFNGENQPTVKCSSRAPSRTAHGTREDAPTAKKRGQVRGIFHLLLLKQTKVDVRSQPARPSKFSSFRAPFTCRCALTPVSPWSCFTLERKSGAVWGAKLRDTCRESSIFTKQTACCSQKNHRGVWRVAGARTHLVFFMWDLSNNLQQALFLLLPPLCYVSRTPPAVTRQACIFNAVPDTQCSPQPPAIAATLYAYYAV